MDGLHRDARASAGIEICGLLLGRDGGIEDVVPSANIALAPAEGFEIDPAVHLRAQREARAAGWRVLGSYHSHPSGDLHPSLPDAVRVDRPGMLWMILGQKDAALWLAGNEGLHRRFMPVRLEIVG